MDGRPAAGRSAGPPRGDHRPVRSQDGHQCTQLGRERLHGRFRGLQLPDLGEFGPWPAQPARRRQRDDSLHQSGGQDKYVKEIAWLALDKEDLIGNNKTVISALVAGKLLIALRTLSTHFPDQEPSMNKAKLVVKAILTEYNKLSFEDPIDAWLHDKPPPGLTSIEKAWRAHHTVAHIVAARLLLQCEIFKHWFRGIFSENPSGEVIEAASKNVMKTWVLAELTTLLGFAVVTLSRHAPTSGAS